MKKGSSVSPLLPTYGEKLDLIKFISAYRLICT